MKNTPEKLSVHVHVCKVKLNKVKSEQVNHTQCIRTPLSQILNPCSSLLLYILKDTISVDFAEIDNLPENKCDINGSFHLILSMCLSKTRTLVGTELFKVFARWDTFSVCECVWGTQGDSCKNVDLRDYSSVQMKNQHEWMICKYDWKSTVLSCGAAWGSKQGMT